MRAIFTIAGKDLKNLLTSPLFFVISGLCTFMWSYSFMRNLFDFAEQAKMYMGNGSEGQSIMRAVFLPHISQINLLFVFVVPALTMRLLAEEKRLRTFDLLLTAPISATDIAVGKFLAGWGSILALTLISFLYPLGTRLVVSYSMGPLLSAYLGVLLVSSAYVGVGLFASSLTQSLILSVVMGLIFNILLWFISQGAGTDLPPSVSAVLEYMSLGQHFLNFILGSIKLKSVVFLLSLTGLFVFLTQRVVESARWR